eukprot:COSAG06_NODE_2158_length_7449_cov_14.166939_7_plen_90_part_00
MAASDVPDARQEYGLPPLAEDCEYDDAWLTSTARRINWCANVRALIQRGDGPGGDVGCTKLRPCSQRSMGTLLLTIVPLRFVLIVQVMA